MHLLMMKNILCIMDKSVSNIKISFIIILLLVSGYFLGDEFLYGDIHWIIHMDWVKNGINLKHTHMIFIMSLNTSYMIQNHQPILLNHKLYSNTMKWSLKVKSLKFIDIYSNKTTYKYIVFLYSIKWKRKTHINVETLKMMEILKILVNKK